MAGAMRCPTVLCGVLLLLATVALASFTSGAQRPCQCLPPQWEATLKSRRRTVDMRTGKWRVSENVWTVHYDYRRHQLAAMLSADSNSKIIADSEKGFTYMLNDDGCHAIHSGIKVERKCEPTVPEALEYFDLANGRAVVRWKHTGPVNTTTRTTIALDNCMPVTQDVYSTHRGFVMIVTSVFSNVRRGIEDRHVFDMPPDCRILDTEGWGVNKRFYHDPADPAVQELNQEDTPAFL